MIERYKEPPPGGVSKSLPSRRRGTRNRIDSRFSAACQRLGGLFEEPRAARLAWRQLDRRGHRGVVYAFEQNDPTAVVDDRDDATPVVALRLGLSRRLHLPRRFQAQRLPLQELR
jgi:hypothetical protein